MKSISRLQRTFRLIVPRIPVILVTGMGGEQVVTVTKALPGFPGALGHDRLDDISDWIAATLDLLEQAGLEGADLVGASAGGMLAAEVAAFSPATVRRLVLVAPFGLFDAQEAVADPFARKPREIPELLCSRAERFIEQRKAPPDEDVAEWMITLARADEAAARLLWPLGERGLAKRLHRVRVPTLVAWGEQDRVIPPSYAERFVRGIGSNATALLVPGAGHLVDLDAPDELGRAIEEFLDAS